MTDGDIRALKDAVDQLCAIVIGNSDLLREVVEFQAAQDEREASQVEIARDVARVAHSITTLVESQHVQIQELTGLVKNLSLSTAADKAMETMIAKIEGAGIAIDRHPD